VESIWRTSKNRPTGPGNHPIPSRYFLSLATLEPRKNQLAIIDGFEQYRDRTGDRVALVFAGGAGWKSAPVLKRARHSKYAFDIHLMGFVSEEQKEALYQGADILLFPSFYEGFGLPVLEALRYGTPVITSHTGSLPELTGQAAILVDPLRVHDLVYAIQTLMGSKNLQHRLREQGQHLAQALTWRRSAQATLSAFESAVAA
jgi:glycosyltransferase involved in cell wall biosynthesis